MKSNWYDKEKKDFFKEKPKLNSSGMGLRLNKGKGGCPPSKQKKFGQGKDFTPERAMKLTGATVLTSGAVLVGTELLKDVGDAL